MNMAALKSAAVDMLKLLSLLMIAIVIGGLMYVTAATLPAWAYFTLWIVPILAVGFYGFYLIHADKPWHTKR